MEKHGKEKHRSKSDKSALSANAKEKGKSSRDPPKKTFKIVIRKLPLREYTFEHFEKCVTSFCERIGLGADSYQIEHFIQGKLSRKHGPVPGAGFVCIKDEDALKKILGINLEQVSFLEDESDQPELGLAPYQKTFRVKEKPDKLMGTYKTDPEFENFLAKLEVPVQKRPSAEQTIEAKQAAVVVHDPKDNALLKFLREKSERKIAERKTIKSKDKLTSTSASAALKKPAVAAEGSRAAAVLLKKSLSEKSSLSRSSVRAEREKDRDGDKERPRRVVKGAIREGLAHASTEDADMQAAIKLSIATARKEAAAAALLSALQPSAGGGGGGGDDEADYATGAAASARRVGAPSRREKKPPREKGVAVLKQRFVDDYEEDESRGVAEDNDPVEGGPGRGRGGRGNRRESSGRGRGARGEGKRGR